MVNIKRNTKETQIDLSLELYAGANGEISTGVGFFDHMLNSFKVHGGFDLALNCKGDTFVDCHHTVEDCGIALGKAFCEALGDKSGIKRFGVSYVPMDEALAFVCVDISARPYLVYEAPEMPPMIGSYDTQMTQEFLRAFCVNAGITLHAKILYGDNAHHMVEALYKALGRALADAITKTSGGVLSTKGSL